MTTAWTARREAASEGSPLDLNWNALNAVASTVSMVAFVLTAVYVRGQVRGLEKDRFVTITNDLFTTWQSAEFLRAQFWVVHSLKETTWEEFVRAHRGDEGEVAFHRVGAFYDRVGSLVGLGLIQEAQILPTVGGHAIAVWRRIEPLVREARRLENSTLFESFERLLPACLDCYVPASAGVRDGRPFSLEQPESVAKIPPRELADRLARGGPAAPTVLDVRPPSQVESEPLTLPGAVLMPADAVDARAGELPRDREVVAFCT